MTPIAIVMNMFYAGLGVARSLGEKGIPVIGLTAHHRIYGNFTRYADIRFCPDSREKPEELLAFLENLAETLTGGAMIFPTRDDDLIFLDRFRGRLRKHFTLIAPSASALRASLDKWLTYECARAADVPAPRCLMIAGEDDLLRIVPQLQFPAVLKPVSAHHWRKGNNWEKVGGRKAIVVSSVKQLTAEYRQIAAAESKALIQEIVPGADDCLHIAACYMDSQSKLVAGFTAQKLLQVPDGFGTGCIVRATDYPELLPAAGRLLQKVGFTGIAEVEFKWDSSAGEYKLIEINPRPWDQHRLGKACGVDLIHIAYCDFAGLPLPIFRQQNIGQKWIAEDAFFLRTLKSVWRFDGQFFRLLRLARGQRTYAIWSMTDPLPLLGFVALRFVPELLAVALRRLWSSVGCAIRDKVLKIKGVLYEKRFEDAS